jgi:hypothetical protein
MVAPYSAAPPGAEAARAMLARSVPLEMVQASASANPGANSGIIQAGGIGMEPSGMISPPGVPGQPGAPGMPPPPGAVAAVGALTAATQSRFVAKRTEVSFTSPQGMKVSWYAPSSNGKTGFSSNRIDVPGRYNFVQAAIYRLKLSDIPNRPGVELYPTLEVVPANAQTDSFLAHSAVPVSFTNEDFDQVAAGNYLIKVIYLPNPNFQEFVTTGPEEVVSSRLEPGVDPIAEAHRRGSILLVVRLGNIDLELANSPAMDAPGQYGPSPASPPHGHGMRPGAMPGGKAMMMGPNGPMMMGPNGPMPIGPNGGPAPAGPSTPTPSASVSGGPVSMLPDSSALQQSQYASPVAGMPSAGPSSEASDKKPAVSRKWVWPN